MLTVSQIKVHSRKQLVAWVQSTNVYKFEQLKNGLFFLKILKRLVPQDSIKQKMYQRPVNVYEYTYNMNGVKRILNKHNLLMNMDVSAIVDSKNCFQFANWFKNLYDQNKSEKDDEFVYAQKNFTPSKTNSSFKNKSSGMKNFIRANSSDVNSRSDKSKSLKKIDFFKQVQDNRNFLSKFKIGKNVHIPNVNQSIYKLKTMASNEKQSKFISPPKKISQSQYIQKKNIIKVQQVTDFQDSQTFILNLLKIQALNQSIQSFQKILNKIQNYINNSQIQSLNQMKQNIFDIIYMRK